jgi:hypothetical protein
MFGSLVISDVCVFVDLRRTMREESGACASDRDLKDDALVRVWISKHLLVIGYLAEVAAREASSTISCGDDDPHLTSSKRAGNTQCMAPPNKERLLSVPLLSPLDWGQMNKHGIREQVAWLQTRPAQTISRWSSKSKTHLARHGVDHAQSAVAGQVLGAAS